MNDLFRKIFEALNLSKESRTPEMAGPDQPGPAESASQEGGALEGKANPITAAKEKAEMKAKMAKLFKGLDSAVPSVPSGPSLKDLMKGVQIAPTPGNEPLAPRDTAPSTPQESIQIAGVESPIDRSNIPTPDLKKDQGPNRATEEAQLAMEREFIAKDLKANPERASQDFRDGLSAMSSAFSPEELKDMGWDQMKAEVLKTITASAHQEKVVDYLYAAHHGGDAVKIAALYQLINEMHLPQIAQLNSKYPNLKGGATTAIASSRD